MTDDKLDISRRKMLGAIGTVGGAAALGGASTMAFFSDEENFANNRLVAGELDLKVDWEEHYSDWSNDEMAFMNDDMEITDMDGFMNATLIESYPDEDNDGVQDDIVDPCGPNSNLGDMPEALSSDLRTNKPDGFHGQATASGDPLINIQDLKPGDTGEVTFSFHLCDNPGYVWLTGELLENAENGYTEPEWKDPDEDRTDTGELLDEILVEAWYDTNCDNVFDEEESVIFEWGTLRQFLDSLQDGPGKRLSPAQAGTGGDGTNGDDTDNGTTQSCNPLGKLEWKNGEFHVEDDDSNDSSGAVGDRFELVADDDTGATAVIEIQDIEYKDGDPDEPITVHFDIVTDESNVGICQIDVKAGNNDVKEYDTGDLCITGATNVSSGELFVGNNNQPAISYLEFYYCDLNGGGGQDEPNGDCFDPSTTHCIGLAWKLPVDHANEIQTDSVAFDVGFYTEQCRHNDGSGMANTNG